MDETWTIHGSSREFTVSITVEPLTNDHPSHTTTFRVTDSGFCSYTNPSRATIPLIRPHQCDSEGGRIRGVLLYRLCISRRIDTWQIV